MLLFFFLLLFLSPTFRVWCESECVCALAFTIGFLKFVDIFYALLGCAQLRLCRLRLRLLRARVGH